MNLVVTYKIVALCIVQNVLVMYGVLRPLENIAVSIICCSYEEGSSCAQTKQVFVDGYFSTI